MRFVKYRLSVAPMQNYLSTAARRLGLRTMVGLIKYCQEIMKVSDIARSKSFQEIDGIFISDLLILALIYICRYCTRNIITSNLYTYYPIFEVHFFVSMRFLQKILSLCMVSIQEWFVIKIGL